MSKLLGTIIIFIIIMGTSIPNHVLSSGSSNDDKYGVFYAEIEKKGSIDLGSRYFLYNLKNGTNIEIKSAYFDGVVNGMPVPTLDFKRVAFFTQTNQTQYLNVLNLAKNEIEKRVKIPSFSGELALSKDMRYITFYRNLDMYEKDNREICFYNNKQGKLTQITTNDYPDYNPVFSPSGDYILYLSKPSLKSTILKRYHIAKAITEDVKTFSGTGYELAQWAENGLVLIINHNQNGTPFWLDLKSGQIKGINLERIYFVKASPDGKRLMYHQAREKDDSTWDLFVSDVSGKNPVMITKPDNVDIFGVEWVVAR